jgi:hypothetical protein
MNKHGRPVRAGQVMHQTGAVATAIHTSTGLRWQVRRANIMQRNSLGYMTIDGIQCDINEAHTDHIGAFVPGAPVVITPPTPPAPVDTAAPLSNAQMQDLSNMVSIIFQQVAGIVPGLKLLPGSPTPFPSPWPASLADVLGLNKQTSAQAKPATESSTRKRA